MIYDAATCCKYIGDNQHIDKSKCVYYNQKNKSDDGEK